LIEIGIPSADSCDPVLTHEKSRVCVVQQIAGEMWQFRNDLSSDVGMSLRRDE
jgi:hypothetical protein